MKGARRTVSALLAALGGGLTLHGGAIHAATDDPEQIKSTVQEVLARGPYNLEPADYYALDLSWLFDWIRRLLDLISVPFGHASPIVATFIIVTLIVILAALVAHIMYSFYAAMRVAPSSPVELQRTALANPDDLENEAASLAAERNFVDATRTLFRAALVRLETKRGGRMMSALTNSEYLRTFRKEWVIESLRVFVDVINGKWYRDRTFDESDYLRCAGAYDALRARLDEEG